MAAIPGIVMAQTVPLYQDSYVVVALARALYLDVPSFQSCLDGGKYKQMVIDNQKLGAGVGVVGTPSFVIGKSTPDGVDGVLFVGSQPFEAFDAKIAEFDVQK